MHRRTTTLLTTAALLLAFIMGLPGTPALARRPKNTPTPTPSPAVTASATPAPAASPSVAPTTSTTTAPSLASAIKAMSKLQTLVEFYFMSTGTYPITLAELDQQYNDHAPKDGKKVAVPNDPATNKPFVYEATDDGNAYTLRAPNPAAYGVKSLEVSNIDWGWMRSIAEERKRVQLAELCSIYVKGLGNALDQYARDHKNELPDSLDTLVPKLVKKLPTCPASGKPYIYKKTDRGYEVICPDPKAHDLEVLEYSSTEGFKRR